VRHGEVHNARTHFNEAHSGHAVEHRLTNNRGTQKPGLPETLRQRKSATALAPRRRPSVLAPHARKA
jgi:hypothetical protein